MGMASQDGASPPKTSVWSILLPAIAGLLGAVIGAAGSATATYVTLQQNKATQQQQLQAEQRKLQADSYTKFLDMATTSDEGVTAYESCKDQCNPKAAKMAEIDIKVNRAVRPVFLYGSLDTYAAARKIVENLQARMSARDRGKPDTKLKKEYFELEDEYLRRVCDEINAVRQVC
jgi:hypothetical protein